MEEVSHCRNLFAISTGDQKGAGESIPKALSIPRWKGKNILPSKERHNNVCHTLAVLSANEAEAIPQTYGGGILPWPQISLVGVATLD